MSAPDSDQLEDLLAKVTPGEWCMDGICISGHNYAAGDVCYMGEPAHWSGDTARMLPNWENNATLIALAPALLRELIQLRAEVEALRALLRTGCDLLAIEREALREGISIGGVMSPGPEDVVAVEALNEIDDWIASATATLTAGDSHDD